MAESIPSVALDAVLKPSGIMPEGSLQIKGYDFNRGIDYQALMQSYLTTGYQASSFGQAVQQINVMIEKKLEPLDEDEQNTINLNPCQRERSGCTIFLGYTSNLISSGIRETIRYLAQHN
ncbi:hypothetical protein scyTo_0025806, partial [Scyliorhinus torazame]|nr:hypothetical protein [Scyliorhinus torazame]